MSILVAFVIMLPWQTHQKFLSNYKSLIFDDPKKVVLLDHDSYSNGESGPEINKCKVAKSQGKQLLLQHL